MHRLLTYLLVVTVVGCGSADFDQSGSGKKERPGQQSGSQGGTTPSSKNRGGAKGDQDGPKGAPTADQEVGAGSQSGDQSTPATDPVVDPGQKGPFAFASYTDGLTDAGYASAVVFYPTNSTRTLAPATTLSGGFTNTKEDMLWLAEHLASHGFIVIAFTPTNNMVLDPNVWAKGHIGAVAKIKAESTRDGSPVKGKVDVQRVGVSGFSMGGAGTIVAVNQLGEAVQASVPICAYRPQVPAAKVPTLFLTGTNDGIASPEAIRQAFTSAQTGAPKALANFKGMTHFDVYQASGQHRNLARYMTAWYKVHLMSHPGYAPFLEGEEAQKDRAAGVFAADADLQYVKGP